MNLRMINYSLVAAFSLAGAVMFPSVSQVMAEDARASLASADAAATQEQDTEGAVYARENVEVDVSGSSDLVVPKDDAATVINDASTGGLKAGDMMAGGAIYAGNGFAVTAADAPTLYTWIDGQRYCDDLEAHGYDDWRLPSNDQLNHLYENRGTGALAGTFNEGNIVEASRLNAPWYWSSEEHPDNGLFSKGYHGELVWYQEFLTGDSSWARKDAAKLSVRCVRPVRAASYP